MTANVRAALNLVSPFATTGIGSLPHSQLELGLQMALSVDIPFLPQMPAGNPSEFMITSALEGLPGATSDAEGLVTVGLSAWREASFQFGQRIEAALQSESISEFEPSPAGCRAWKPFLWEVENRKRHLAKVQLAGPTTVRWAAKVDDGQPVSAHPSLDQQMFRLLLARGVAMVRALRRAGTMPIIFLDEPGLYALDRRNPQHIIALSELKMMVLALRREGALVGLHCCSNTDWASVLGLGLDILSLDVRLSLDAVLDESEAVTGFLAEGSSFSLGIIPTNTGSTFDVGELVDAVDVSLNSALPKAYAQRAMSHALLTPACGLAMRSVADTEKIFGDLREAQRMLLASNAASVTPEVTGYTGGPLS
jgi:hypothetical protein